MASDDTHFMAMALRLARRGLGNVWPNPAVGCVVVAGGGPRRRVVGRGWTQPGGRPHAETEAISRAREVAGANAPRGACAYVTLEPCDHHGQTPPCSQALIDAGIARVVVACHDPDRRASGAGIARLREASIEVVEDICGDAAREVNRGYFLRQERGRPLVTLKCATTLDGRIATHSGQARWITGDAARARGHLMRAQHDGIAVGLGTAVADDPMLDCRLPGLRQRSPVRVVFDSRAQLPTTGRLATTAAAMPTWVVTTAAADAAHRDRLSKCGVVAIPVAAGANDRVDPALAMLALGERGLTRLLVEGGAALSGALLQANLVDRVAWFRGPLVLGDDGVAAIPPLGVSNLDEAPRFRRLESVQIGQDTLETFACEH